MHKKTNNIKRSASGIGIILGLLFFVAPQAAVAAEGDIISLWTDPLPSSAYAFDDDVFVTGAWTLPPDFVGRIYVSIDGVEVNQITFDSIGAAATTTAPFSWNSGLHPTGSHDVKLEAAMVNYAWIVDPDNNSQISQIDVYGTRTFDVGASPNPNLTVTPNINSPIVALSYPNIQIGDFFDKTFTIDNTGGGIVSGSITGMSGSFACISGCTYNLDANDPAITATIRFSPVDTSTVNQTLNFTCVDASCNDENRVVEGWGAPTPVPGQINANIPLMNFGSLNLGDTDTANVTLTNIGGLQVSGSTTIPTGLGNQYTCISNCSYTLDPGDSVVVTIQYAPTIAGQDDVTAFFSGGTGDFLDIKGLGNDLPILSVSPTFWMIATSTVTNVGGPPRLRTFLVQNVGSQLLNGSVSVAPSTDFYCFSGCTYTNIPNGGGHIVTLAFEPTVAGVVLNANALFTNNLGSDISVPLTGVGNDLPVAGLNITGYNFGNVLVGSSVSASAVTVTNNGTGTLTVSSELVDTYYTCTANCNFSLGPNESRTIEYTFAPLTAGQSDHSMTLTTNVGNTNVTLRGRGVVPSLNITPANQDAGVVNVGSTREVSFTVHNNGSAGSGNYTVNATGAPFFACSLNCGPIVLVPGDQAQVRFMFAPLSAIAYSDTVFFNTSHSLTAATSSISRTVQGQGNLGPRIQISGSIVDFGTVNVGGSDTRTLTITNIGLGTLSGSATTSAPFSCITSPCTFNLAGGASKDLTLRFSPTVSGFTQQTLQIPHNGSNSITDPTLQGTGNAQPAIQVVPGVFQDFGDIDLGQLSDITFNVSNVGLGVLNGSVNIPASAFTCISNCAYAVPAGGTQQSVLRFAPLTTGAQSVNATFTGGGNQVVQLFGEGIFASIISIVTVDSDFGQVVVGKSKERKFTIKNKGTGTLGPGTFIVTGPFTCVDPTPCDYTLGPSGEIEIILSFNPAVAGSVTGNVQLSTVPLAQFTVRGTGIPPEFKYIER